MSILAMGLCSNEFEYSVYAQFVNFGLCEHLFADELLYQH